MKREIGFLLFLTLVTAPGSARRRDDAAPDTLGPRDRTEINAPGSSGKEGDAKVTAGGEPSHLVAARCAQFPHGKCVTAGAPASCNAQTLPSDPTCGPFFVDCPNSQAAPPGGKRLTASCLDPFPLRGCFSVQGNVAWATDCGTYKDQCQRCVGLVPNNADPPNLTGTCLGTAIQCMQKRVNNELITGDEDCEDQGAPDGVCTGTNTSCKVGWDAYNDKGFKTTDCWSDSGPIFDPPPGTAVLTLDKDITAPARSICKAVIYFDVLAADASRLLAPNGSGGLKDPGLGTCTDIGIGKFCQSNLQWPCTTNADCNGLPLLFDGVNIEAAVKPIGLQVPEAPCIAPVRVTQSYMADVTAIVQGDKKQTYRLSGLPRNTGAIADERDHFTQGATLVVIYQNPSPGEPVRTVCFYDGTHVTNDAEDYFDQTVGLLTPDTPGSCPVPGFVASGADADIYTHISSGDLNGKIFPVTGGWNLAGDDAATLPLLPTPPPASEDPMDRLNGSACNFGEFNVRTGSKYDEDQHYSVGDLPPSVGATNFRIHMEESPNNRDCFNSTAIIASVTVDPNAVPDCRFCGDNVPTCNAGGSYNVSCQGGVGEVHLDGCASCDCEAGQVHYLWTTDCPGGTIDEPESCSPTLMVTGPPPCPVQCTVTLTVTDTFGQQATPCSATVTVTDITPPVLTVPPECPGGGAFECNKPGGLDPNSPELQQCLDCIAVDECSTASDCQLAALPDPLPSGCVNAPGMTTVHWTATDECENVGSATTTVLVVDTTPPMVTAPGPIQVQCMMPGGTPIGDMSIQDWLNGCMVQDVCDTNATCKNDAPPVFPYVCPPPGGTTTVVTFTGMDSCNNQAQKTSSVTVIDTLPPMITPPPPLTVECDHLGGINCEEIKFWLDQAVGKDACDGPVDVTNDACALFPDGGLPGGCPPGSTTTITFSAHDCAGNTTTASSTVTVLDNTGPVVTDCALEPVPPMPPGSPSSTPSSPTSPGSFNFAGRAILRQLMLPSAPAEPSSPASPGSPNSAFSCASDGFFKVKCGTAVDACSPPIGAFHAKFVVTHHVTTDVPCELLEIMESIDVECDEIVELRLSQPPCAASSSGSEQLFRSQAPRAPASPASPGSPGSPGSVRVIEGEHILLQVFATDACGNVSENPCEIDPTLAIDPITGLPLLCAPPKEPCSACPPASPSSTSSSGQLFKSQGGRRSGPAERSRRSPGIDWDDPNQRIKSPAAPPGALPERRRRQ